MKEEQEVTPEHFKVRVLKQRFAEALANAEDTISDLAVANQQQKQYISQLEEQLNATQTEEKANGEG